MIGNKLFDYEITRKIKAGGMGVVYEARRVWGKRERVAIKFLLEQLRDDENIRRRFIREAEILEMLTHPGIVKILGLDPDRDAFVMEFVEGKTLAEQLRSNPQLYHEPQVAVGMFAKLLDAFDYAHHVVIEIGTRREQGVIHRDIKPSNIIIEPDGSPKILDFGISRISTFESTLTDPKLQMGSIAYMSPEQIVNPAGVDWRSDIYALGVNLWELFAARSPYPQVTNFDMVIQVQNSIRNEPLPLLSELHSTGTDPEQQAFLERVDVVVARATAKDPAQRYQRCGDMRVALMATLTPEHHIASVTPVESQLTFTDSATSSPAYSPLQAEAAEAFTDQPAESDWLLNDSVTRVQEPEFVASLVEPEPVASLVEADMPATAVQQLPLTPDGSFRPVINPAISGGSTLKKAKLSGKMGYLVVGLMVMAGIIWWIQSGPSGQSSAAQATVSAADSSMVVMATADSYYETGKSYFFGQNNKPKDFKQAASWYEKSAILGNSDAQNFLGYMYQNGLGVDLDYTKAVSWFQKSAEQGNADGQKNLGFMYEKGLGVPQDYALAMKWFKASAEQGNAEGRVNLGVMYENAEGVPRNLAEARKWYRRAATQDSPSALAQFYVGVMFQWGQGEEQSISKAIQWYKLAARQGQADAQAQLKLLGHTW